VEVGGSFGPDPGITLYGCALHWRSGGSLREYINT
jgi:hypothetical protein